VLFTSKNKWMQWQPTDGWNNVSAVYDLLVQGGRVYAGVNRQGAGFVYRSDSSGMSWSPLAEFPNTRSIAVQCLLQHPTLGLCAGVETRPGSAVTMVWRLPEQATQWDLVGTTIDLANAVYGMVAYREDLIVGTGYVNGNLFRYTAELTEGPIMPAKTIPDRPFLGQNYPNPFNPTTTIRFSVGGGGTRSGASGSGSEWVRLTVHDLLGREVAVLVNENKNPGEYTVTWDAGKMASGVYFYRLHAGSFLETKKMLVLK
jgi:hypothetical protein